MRSQNCGSLACYCGVIHFGSLSETKQCAAQCAARKRMLLKNQGRGSRGVFSTTHCSVFFRRLAASASSSGRYFSSTCTVASSPVLDSRMRST